MRKEGMKNTCEYLRPSSLNKFSSPVSQEMYGNSEKNMQGDIQQFQDCFMKIYVHLVRGFKRCQHPKKVTA